MQKTIRNRVMHSVTPENAERATYPRHPSNDGRHPNLGSRLRWVLTADLRGLVALDCPRCQPGGPRAPRAAGVPRRGLP